MSNTKIPTVRWDGKDLFILDQTLLPITVKEIKLNTVEEAYNSIKELKVRGAPAIGVAAAYSLLIKLREKTNLPTNEFFKIVKERADYLNSSRPTAVNLSYALNRMVNKIESLKIDSSLDLYIYLYI